MGEPKRYRCLIFDVDDTLLDFGCAYASAQKDVAAWLGVDCSDAFRKAGPGRFRKNEKQTRNIMKVFYFGDSV